MARARSTDSPSTGEGLADLNARIAAAGAAAVTPEARSADAAADAAAAASE